MFSQIFTSGIAALCLAYIANAAPASPAALVSVPNFGSNPTGLQMNIYVPTKVAAKPAVILAVSSQSTYI
jgi:acetylxylan esterase